MIRHDTPSAGVTDCSTWAVNSILYQKCVQTCFSLQTCSRKESPPASLLLCRKKQTKKKLEKADCLDSCAVFVSYVKMPKADAVECMMITCKKFGDCFEFVFLW